MITPVMSRFKPDFLSAGFGLGIGYAGNFLLQVGPDLA
jgi:hypothetical protein